MRATVNVPNPSIIISASAILIIKVLLSKDFVDALIGITSLYTKIATIYLTLSPPHFIVTTTFCLCILNLNQNLHDKP